MPTQTTDWYYSQLPDILATLPASCTRLSLSLDHIQTDDDVQWYSIPAQVKVLSLRKLAWEVRTDTSQLQIVRLDDCDCDDVVLPNSLRELYMKNSVLPPVLNHGLRVSESGLKNNFVNKLPVTVKVLKLPHSYDYAITTLPPELEHLDVGKNFSGAICTLPDTVQQFIMQTADRSYKHSLAGKLPNGLKLLKVSTLKHSLGELPDNLVELHYSACRHALGALPSTLQTLHISGLRFNSSLGKLPQSLRELHMSKAYGFKHSLGELPKDLKVLTILAGSKCSLIRLAPTSSTRVVRESFEEHFDVPSYAVTRAVATIDVQPWGTESIADRQKVVKQIKSLLLNASKITAEDERLLRHMD
jgi:hypothetical protein